MNDIAFKHEVDEFHIEMLKCDIKPLTQKWWKLLHHILLIEEIKSERAKKSKDAGKCINDSNRDCDCVLRCTYWLQKWEDVLRERKRKE